LSFEASGYQIYRLREGAVASCGEALPPVRAFESWRQSREFVLGGRKNLMPLRLGTAPLAAGAESRSWNPTPLFLRETNTVLLAEAELPRAADSPERQGASPAAWPRASGTLRQWRLELELEGEGYVQVQVQPRGTGAAARLVADRPLEAAAAAAAADRRPAGVQVLQRRLRLDANEQRLDLRLEHRGHSRVRVHRAALVPLCPP
jgi:hypothetical protein